MMKPREQLKLLARRVLPAPLYGWLTGLYGRIMEGYIPVGAVDLGSFGSISPVSRCWGADRGLPVNRYYIEHFLARHAGDIRGDVLEIGDALYTRKYGGPRVRKSDVLHVREGTLGATIIADLTNAANIASDSFDCLIITQTLHLIYDMHAALRTIHRILRPGGVALVTVPGIDPIHDPEWADTWYWTFTNVSALRLFEEVFPPDRIEVEAWGNVVSAVAFLEGLAAQELTQQQLDFRDPAYQVLVSIRAVKPGERS
jgi:SAM-dependent methyltransferase